MRSSTGSRRWWGSWTRSDACPVPSIPSAARETREPREQRALSWADSPADRPHSRRNPPPGHRSGLNPPACPPTGTAGPRTSRRPSPATPHSAPAETRSDVCEDRLEDVGVVVDAELVGDRQQHGVGGRDRLVAGQLLDQLVGLGRVRAPEHGPEVVDDADRVLGVEVVPEVRTVLLRDQREDGAADRDSRLVVVTRGLPRRTERLDLLLSLIHISEPTRPY